MRNSVIILLLILASCTVRPKIPVAQQPSFDGSARNSGLLAYIKDGPENARWIVTDHWRERYNRLIDLYGPAFNIAPDSGLVVYTNGTWLVDSQHHAYFATMNRWKRQNKEFIPAGTNFGAGVR